MKKKAFTLTELLVVVVIIGVLSAVVLPKFRQVVENRKVAEAEEMLTAVRNEQHTRCLLDKKYTMQTSQLAFMPTNQGKNFTYTLEATGMTAKPVKQGRNFTLQIGYADGTLCCKGSGCNSLSRDYPPCEQLPADTGCAAPMVEEEEPVVGQEGLCDIPETKDVQCSAVNEYGDGWKGTVHYVLDKETCSYKKESNTCEREIECDESKKETERDCPQGCGKYPVTATCDTSTGEWVYEEERSSCKEPETEERDCSEAEEGSTGTQTRTQVCKDGEWTYDGVEWEGKCEKKIFCTPGEKNITQTQCGVETGKKCKTDGSGWEDYTAEIELTQQEKATCSCQLRPADETRACPEGMDGIQTRTYSCQNGEWIAGQWQGNCVQLAWKDTDWEKTNRRSGGSHPVVRESTCPKDLNDAFESWANTGNNNTLTFGSCTSLGSTCRLRLEGMDAEGYDWLVTFTCVRSGQ